MRESVSILICTRDRREMLDELLGDLRAQRYEGKTEIVVVEETDEPREPAGVTYLQLPVRNLGIAYARNRALATASHELVVFVDDDCRVTPDWLDKLLAPFGDADVLGAQGGVTVPEGCNAIGWAETLLGFPGGGISRVHRAAGKNQQTLEVSTLNAAYRRAAVLDAGGFPEQARFGGEDYLLAKQVAKQGHLLFVPDALVRHEARGEWPAIWRWFVRRGRAEVDMLQNGLSPAGYGYFLVRSSLLLKLVLTLLSVPWLGWWPPLLLLAGTMGSTWWRLRWTWQQAAIPRTAWLVAPLVRLWMDLATDIGRMLAWRGGR